MSDTPTSLSFLDIVPIFYMYHQIHITPLHSFDHQQPYHLHFHDENIALQKYMASNNNHLLSSQLQFYCT